MRGMISIALLAFVAAPAAMAQYDASTTPKGGSEVVWEAAIRGISG